MEDIKNGIFLWFNDRLCHVHILTGLEYKFMVKSVDPDGTTAVIENKKEQEDAVISLNPDRHKAGMLEEEGEEVEEYGDQLEEKTSPAPGILPNSTGNNNHFHLTH